MRALLAILLLSVATQAQDMPAGCGDLDAFPLVYTWQPRYDKPITDTAGKVLYESGAQWQDFYDGGQPDVFSESDVVLNDMKGTVTDIYNCTGDDKHICAAHDIRVSPDASRALFTVARGTTFREVNKIQGLEFLATNYELWLHDFGTGENRLLDSNARMGDWSGNDSIVFASNRAGIYPPWATAGADYPAMGLHVYRAALAGRGLTGVFDLTPWAASCMSPAVNPDGTVVASCWNGFGERGYKRTPLNLYWLEQVSGNGTNHRVIAGAHGSPYWKTRDYLAGVCATDAKGQPVNCGEGSTSFRVLRSYVALRRDRYAVTNYYRSNHQGAQGSVFVCERNQAEGYLRASQVPELTERSDVAGSGRYVPQCYVATPFGNDADNIVRFHRDGRAMGKAGYPFPVAQTMGTFGFTLCRGNCYSPSGPDRATRAYAGGEPTSKREIRIAAVDRVIDPFDPDQSLCVAGCGLRENAFDARVVAPYQALYGQAEPLPPAPVLTGTTTTLEVENARLGELYKLTGPNVKPYDDCSLQGCADDDWMIRLAAIRIEEILPWKTKPPGKGFAGVKLVGDYPLQPDGSVSMTFPCGITYQLSGIDKDGATVAKDNSLHSAVCGETVTCKGCHDAHSTERAAALEATP